MKNSYKIMGILILTTFMVTSIFVANFGYCEEQVLVEWFYQGDVPNSRSYWLITVTYIDRPGEPQKLYDGWCADTRNYLPTDGFATVSLYSSTKDKLPFSISNDEQWPIVNYIFDQWYKGNPPFNGATWKDIQQVVWIYTDSNYDPHVRYIPPIADWAKVDAINNHIKGLSNIPNEVSCEAMILDLNNPIYYIGDKPAQLLFFIVPEIPLGVLGAVTTMFGAYFTKIRLSRRKKITL